MAWPDSVLEKLLTSRSKANLGKAAERALDFVQRPVVACAPAPHSPVVTTSHQSAQNSQLAAIIRDELNKLV
jgi:hypothetical protein